MIFDTMRSDCQIDFDFMCLPSFGNTFTVQDYLMWLPSTAVKLLIASTFVRLKAFL